ncbi:hypothetical protein BDD12DRAFT_876890 [Trichophaea hybrida]|nr:hypothetical protein BDD12DRAFT_876890 [Trichophaea hybrida]
MPAPDGMVTDISLVGRWDPRGESGAADVMVYAKVVTPQPSCKVSLLHLQPLILQSTLVRVVPLLPDGTSPWESPGVEALNIATVSGRRARKSGRPHTPGLSFSKKVRHILIDGTCGNTSDDGSAGGYTLEPAATRHDKDSTDVNGVDLEMVSSPIESHDKDDIDPGLLPNYQYTSEFGSTLSTLSSGSDDSEENEHLPFIGFQDLNLSLSGITLGEDGIQDHLRGNSTPSTDQGGPWLPTSPAVSESPEFGMSPFEIAGKRCISYSRNSDGDLQRVPVDNDAWERINMSSSRLQSIGTIRSRISSLTYPPRVDDRGRIFSSGSYLSVRSVSPLPGSLVEDLKRGDLTSLTSEASLPYGQDGTGEVKEKYKEKRRGAKQVLFSEDQQDEPEDRHITISVEKNSLFLCFPKNIRSDSVVAEILLKVRPILLGQNKNYYTFIFSGLPFCQKPAFFDFKVDSDDEEWVFDVGDHEQTAKFEPLGLDEANRFRGQLYLRDKTPTQRSILMRIQNVPSHAEIHNYKIRSKTNALFSWTPDGNVTAEFEIKVYFVDVEAVENVARNLVNLILINGIEDAESICITSSSGRREKFSLEGPIMKGGEELQSARLLQVPRLLRDIRDTVTISFRKVQRSVPCYFHIPLVELGCHVDLLEQVVVIHEPRLPLNISFTPDLSFWKDLNEETDLPGSRKITRIVETPKIEYPRVLVSLLSPVSSTANKLLSKYQHLNFIDKITYEIEEHSSSLWKPRDPRPLHLRMSFTLDGPTDGRTELLRVHSGHFEIEFITINGAPAKRLFMDDEDLVVLNYGQIYCNDGPMTFNVYWRDSRGNTINTIGAGQALEFHLPRVHESLVGRVVCKCRNEDVRIVSRTSFLETGAWTVPLTHGRATLSGLQSFSSRLYLQIPHQIPQLWPPRSQVASIEDSGETTDELLFEHPVCDTASSLDGPPPMPPDLGFTGTTPLDGPTNLRFITTSPLDGALSSPSTIRKLSMNADKTTKPKPSGTDKKRSAKDTPYKGRGGRSWCITSLYVVLLALIIIGFLWPWDLLRPQASIWIPHGLGEETTISNRIESIPMEEYADVVQEDRGEGFEDSMETPKVLLASPVYKNNEEKDHYSVKYDELKDRDEGQRDWEETPEGRVMLFKESWMSLFFDFFGALGRLFF